MTTTENRELETLVDELVSAEKTGDTRLLARTLADDFLGIGPLGFMLTKPEWIQRHESGDLKYTAIELGERRIRTYGDAAVLTGRQVHRATFKGQPINADLRTSQVFVRQGGRWLLAGIQYSAIGAPPGMPPGGPAGAQPGAGVPPGRKQG